MKRQHMSARGREFLKREEGFVPFAYNDPAIPTNATFGVGHMLHPGPVTLRDRLRYGTPKHPRRRKANRMFKRDLREFERAVREAVGRRLPQHKFDALVSLAFNIGIGGFKGSTAARRVREQAGEFLICAAIEMWDVPAMLADRRRRECDLYANGHYHLGRN